MMRQARRWQLHSLCGSAEGCQWGVRHAAQEKDEYVEQIIQDIGRLGLQYEKITYTSDYFPQARCILPLARPPVQPGRTYLIYEHRNGVQ